MCVILQSGVDGSLRKITGFISQYPVLRYEHRNIVIYAGEKPHGVFFIQKGFVRVYSTSAKGKEFTVALLGQKDFFPLVWLYRNEPSEYYYESYSQTEIVKCDREDLLRYIDSNPDISQYIGRDFVVRYQRALKRMQFLAQGNASVRVASALWLLGTKFGHRIGSQILIRISLTHKDIADYSGLTRETASLEIEDLEKKGIISQKAHHFHILDVTKLKAVLE